MLTLGNYTKHWTDCEKRTGINWGATSRVPGAHLEIWWGVANYRREKHGAGRHHYSP